MMWHRCQLGHLQMICTVTSMFSKLCAMQCAKTLTISPAHFKSGHPHNATCTSICALHLLFIRKHVRVAMTTKSTMLHQSAACIGPKSITYYKLHTCSAEQCAPSVSPILCKVNCWRLLHLRNAAQHLRIAQCQTRQRCCRLRCNHQQWLWLQ